MAALLVILLIAEGITILNMRGLRGPHMFIGLMLIPPIALKLASTGYRFVRYYTGAPVYVAKGPPQLALRVLAPLLVATHRDDLRHRRLAADPRPPLRPGAHAAQGRLHRVERRLRRALPRLSPARRALAARGLGARPGARPRTPGRGVTAALVALSLCAGLLLALALLSHIGAWHRGYGF